MYAQLRQDEVFLLGKSADRNECAIATYTPLQIDKVVGMADGTHVLSHLLTLFGEAKELDHLETGIEPPTGCRLGWGRRDQMDLREVGAYPPGVTGQEGQLRNQGMGSNEKVGER